MQQNHAAVVVVGSVNVDLIVRVQRLPRPGETVAGGDFLTAGGGKGANQAVAARRLGADVRLVARVGQDAHGDLTRANFQAEGLATTWVTVDPTAPTGVALITVDRQGENTISVASGANWRLTPDDVRRAEAAFDGAAVLLVQLEIPVETIGAALDLGREHGLTTLLNPAPAPVHRLPDDLLRLVDWLSPNEHELAALSGGAIQSRDGMIQAARGLLGRGPRQIVVTLGDRGALLVTADGAQDIPPIPVRAVDTTAAGDAFSAALAVGLARGEPPLAALRSASAAGALTATRPGAQPSLPRGDEVAALL